MNRLLEQQISQTKPGAVEAVGIRRSYAYDKAGQLVAIGDSRRGNLSYRYDPVGRLLEAHSRLGRETFAFDPAGNIGNPSDTDADTQAAGRVTTRVAVRLNGDGRSMAGRLMDNLLKDYAGTHYTWDERGNLVERSRNGEKTTFTWDGFNRMRSAETFGETTSFSYDALGRRIAKRSSHATNLFGWDGDTLAFESTQSIEGRQEYLGRGDSVHYIHEPGSFVPLVQIRQAQAVALSQTTDVKALIAANGGRYDIERDPLWNGQQLKTPQAFAKEEIAFYQCDHLGTPQELTDHEGRIAWSASYKAWGEAKQAISEAGRKAGFRNPIRFQGQYFDDETGLHYNRYRYYDPHSGRFISSDPIKLRGGINLHRYVLSPVQWIDPLGLAELSQAPDFDTARRQAFERAGMTNPANVSFSKMDPATGTVVEFKGSGGAKVAYDAPHADLDATQGHDKPHVGWQTAGKRGCGCGKRGNITYGGPQHPHRPDEKL